jgi:predicted alpha/beta hydrolase
MCGRTLARAHAKSGDAALISGYLGKSEVFDAAMAEFAVAYADQNERDYEALVAAVKSGRVKALEEEGAD